MKLEVKNWKFYYNDKFMVKLDAPFWKIVITSLGMLIFIILLGLTEI